jgi:hypothetical protein
MLNIIGACALVMFICVIVLALELVSVKNERYRLRHENKALVACINNRAYTREMILGQCLADFYESGR